MNHFYSAWSAGSGCHKVYNISQHQVPNIHSVINEMCFIGDRVYSDDVICCMVWASSSRKNKRKTRPRRKKPREGSSHLTKYVKVPNSWQSTATVLHSLQQHQQLVHNGGALLTTQFVVLAIDDYRAALSPTTPTTGPQRRCIADCTVCTFGNHKTKDRVS